MQKINKPWGHEELVEVNDNYVVKRLLMKKGHKCSLQYHEKKKETVVVLSGTMTVSYNDQVFQMGPSDTLTIDSHVVHRMFAELEDCLYLECSTPELDDVVRLEDEYGRK